MKPWKRIDPTTEHKVGWRIITTKTFLLPDGQKDTFDTVRQEGDAVVVAVALTKDKEAGYQAGPMKYLGRMYRDGYSNLLIHVFLATDCVLHEQGQKLDYNEHIEVDLVSIDQLFDNAKKAKMVDIGAVFMAYDDLQKLRRIS